MPHSVLHIWKFLGAIGGLLGFTREVNFHMAPKSMLELDFISDQDRKSKIMLRSGRPFEILGKYKHIYSKIREKKVAIRET